MDIAVTNDMPYRYLGNTGLKVSILSYGTWLLDYSQKCNDSWVECAKALFKAGVNYFDSAEFYGFGAGDRMLGRAIKEIGCERKDLVISVKIYCNALGPNRSGMSRKHIIEGTKRSLKNLDLEYCDIVFSHRPSYTVDLEETCKAFGWLINKGYAKYWSTSKWEAEMITEAIKICDTYIGN